MENVQGLEYGCRICGNVGRGCGAFDVHGEDLNCLAMRRLLALRLFLVMRRCLAVRFMLELWLLAISSGAAALSGAGASREGLGWSGQDAVLTCGIMVSELGPLTMTIAIEVLMALLASAMRISKRLWQQHVPTPFTLGICRRCHGK